MLRGRFPGKQAGTDGGIQPLPQHTGADGDGIDHHRPLDKLGGCPGQAQSGGIGLEQGKHQGNVIRLRETCHSEAVTDVTAVGIRIQNVRENGLPRQSADWLAMTKPLT